MLPDKQELITEPQQMLEVAKRFVIDSPIMYQIATDELVTIKRKIKLIEAKEDEITKPLQESLKATKAHFKPALELLKSCESFYKDAMRRFQIAESERIARERKAQEEETKRIMLEKQKEAEEKARAENERLKLEAQELEQKTGQKVEVQEVLPEIVEPVLLPEVAQATKAQGASVRTKTKVRLINKSELIKYISNNSMFENLVDVNQTALNALAKAQGDLFNIPGVEAYQEKEIAIRI